VNLEYLARVVLAKIEGGDRVPDTLVGTDSHTTMINGLGVFGWGVGGIEAEAAMLGQPVAMLIPEVIGFKLTGKLKPEGVTATDLVLTVTQMLRKKGVVGKFVEFFGPGSTRSRSPIARPSRTWRPSTARRWASSPSTTRRSRYLRLTGRSEEQVALVERYCKEQGLFRTRRARARASPTRSSSISATSCPRSRAPSVLRIAWRSATCAALGVAASSASSPATCPKTRRASRAGWTAARRAPSAMRRPRRGSPGVSRGSRWRLEVPPRGVLRSSTSATATW
jgi:hypothetical protein